MDTLRVALVGDYSPDVPAHIAIPKALALAIADLAYAVEATWIPTDALSDQQIVDNTLSPYHGVWCVPASPYKNMDGALWAIQWARETQRPFLGTCGGYQHAVLEFARNVLGYAEAGNIEVDPNTPMPIISPLICALVEEKGDIVLTPETQIARIYGAEHIVEHYRCSYGFNPEYIPLFEGSDFVISGYDTDGEPRVIELTAHPFFIGTAFQPERSALRGETHPLISAYVQAIIRQLKKAHA